MTDFEPRAREAARAVHDAMNAPADELAARRRNRGPFRAVMIAAAVILVTAIVGTTLAVRDEGAGPASDVGTFCAQVQTLVSTPVDVVNGERSREEPSLDFLRDAPEEIRPTALAILQARQQRGGNGSVSIEVSQRFLRWWQLRCYPDAATPNGGPQNQRVAPVPAPDGFAPCGGSNGNAADRAAMIAREYGTIAVYGDRTLSDPYEGGMVGVIRSAQQRYYSDDHAVPFPIAGHPDAELIDATGPFGAAIDGLGPAITWKDERGYVSVVGRGWSRDQATELGTIATRVTDGPAGDRLADPGRDGLDELYRGPVGEIYVQYPSPIAATTFTVDYTNPPAALVRLSGSVPGPGGLAATRFFARGLRPATVGGRSVLEGVLPVTNTVDGTTAHVVVWTDGDVMVTLSFDPDQARLDERSVDALVAATHRLDRAEWEQVLEAGSACLFAGRGESASASGSGSAPTTTNGSQVSTGSSTTSTGPTSPTTVTTLGR